MKLLFSFDDTHILDLKVARLLEKNGFKGIFYRPSLPVNGMQNLEWKEVRQLADRGHTRGGHTISHPHDLKKIEDDKILEFEIFENRTSCYFFVNNDLNNPSKSIENPKDIYTFCYPRGRFDSRVKNKVKEAGYKEARTTKVLNTDLPKDLFETNPTIHLHPARKEYQGKNLLDVFKEQLKIAESKGEKGYFHIWGHSWELQQYNLWETFEEMLKILSVKYGKEN